MRKTQNTLDVTFGHYEVRTYARKRRRNNDKYKNAIQIWFMVKERQNVVGKKS